MRNAEHSLNCEKKAETRATASTLSVSPGNLSMLSGRRRNGAVGVERSTKECQRRFELGRAHRRDRTDQVGAPLTFRVPALDFESTDSRFVEPKCSCL